MVKSYIVGSNAFFSGIEGFSPTDRDKLYLVDDCNETGFNFSIALELRLRNNCYFYYKRFPKDEMISYCLKDNKSLCVGKFLVPDVARDLMIDVDDLKTLKPLLDGIDDKHRYEIDIYNAYQENGSLTLTDEQKQKAYITYLKYRNNGE